MTIGRSDDLIGSVRQEHSALFSACQVVFHKNYKIAGDGAECAFCLCASECEQGGMRMKKILLSVILALAIAVSFLPVTASAETVWTEVSDDEAFDNALINGGYIKLTDDIEGSKRLLTCSGNLVVDLNEKLCGDYQPLEVEGDLTFLDSSSDQSGGMDFNTLVKGGTLTLNSGKIIRPTSIYSGGAFIMNGGLAKRELSVDSTLKMNGGTIDVGDREAIRVWEKGIMYANDGIVKSTYKDAALIILGKIVQDAGTSGTAFDCKAEFGKDASVSGGSYMKAVENNGTIYGGTFYGGITGTGKIDGLIVTYKNGSEDYAVQVVQNGDNAVNPIAPTKTGYLFDGWYEDEECTKAFDFENTKITENRTIYSKWKVCDHTGNTNALSCTEDTICSVCSGTIKAAHSLSWKADATHYWQECIREGCDYTTVNNKKEIPTLEIKGKDKVHTDQDYSFSFELPEDSTVVNVEYEMPLAGSFYLKVNVENGIYTGVMSKDNYVAGAENFKVIVTVMMNDGYSFEERKNVMLTDEHEGGTATCNEKAICKVCLEPYGEKNPNNHANLKQFPAKTATAAEEGNNEYWHCDVCGKYFSDENAENEINSADTVIAKLAPSIINGDGQTVTEGEKKALEFTSDAAFEDFISVEVDGETMDSANYTTAEGSIVVTLNADYVATLSVGEHTLGIVSQSGTATAKFTVNEKVAETTTPTTTDNTKSPQTGDNSNIFLWLALLLASGGAVTATTIASKKRKYNR